MTSLGNKIDQLWMLREKKRGLETEIELIDAQLRELETALIQHMETEQTTKAAGEMASVTISESIKPSVEDWVAFHAFIRKHDMFHLLERRASVTGCRELFEQRGVIPGVVPFMQKRVRLVTSTKEK